MGDDDALSAPEDRQPPQDEPGPEPEAPGADMGSGYDEHGEPGPRSEDGPGVGEVFRSGS